MSDTIEIPIVDVWRRHPRPSEAASIAAAVAEVRDGNPDAIIRFVCADGTIYAGDAPSRTGPG